MNNDNKFKPDPAIQLLLTCLGDGGPVVRELMVKVKGAATRVYEMVEDKQRPVGESVTPTSYLTENLDWANLAVPAQLDELRTLLDLVEQVQHGLRSMALVIHVPKKVFEWKTTELIKDDSAGVAGAKKPRPLSDYLQKPHPLSGRVEFGQPLVKEPQDFAPRMAFEQPPLTMTEMESMLRNDMLSNPARYGGLNSTASTPLLPKRDGRNEALPSLSTLFVNKHWCLGCMSNYKVKAQSQEHHMATCDTCGRERELYPVLVPPNMKDLGLCPPYLKHPDLTTESAINQKTPL